VLAYVALAHVMDGDEQAKQLGASMYKWELLSRNGPSIWAQKEDSNPAKTA
jgi:hypothetical protein